MHAVIVTVVHCTSLRQKLVFLLTDLTLWRGYNLYLLFSHCKYHFDVSNINDITH